MEQSRAATAKQLRMALLVARMEQKESPQQRIGRHFGGAHQMAPAICLGFGETEQLARSPRRIEPDPPMEWPQQYPHHFHEKIGNIGIAPIHGSVVGPGITYREYPESPEWFMTIARVIQLAVASPAPGDDEVDGNTCLHKCVDGGCRVSTSLLVSLQKMLTLTQSVPFHERNPRDDAD
jgi:hypothetical protein